MMNNARNPQARNISARRHAGTARVVFGAVGVFGIIGGFSAGAGPDPVPDPVVQTVQVPPVVWPAPGVRVDEDDPLFDCRIDGNGVCGVGAVVPVPDPVRGLVHVDVARAPWPPVHRGVVG